MRRLLPVSSLAAFVALGVVGCQAFQPIQPGGGFPDPTPPEQTTPAPPVEVIPPLTNELLLNPDGGWVASAGAESWATLTTRAGGDAPFSVASVIEFRGTLAEWLAPGDGSDPNQAATSDLSNAVRAALDNDRYVALRLVGLVADDLPPTWPTSTDPPQILPDGVLSLLVEDVGDDDDSAGDDDDSAGDDDDSARGGSGPEYINPADPDWIQYQQAVLSVLADAFASEPGLAFVTVGGVGTDGTWDLPDSVSWFGVAGQAPFTEPSWVSTVGFYSELYRGMFGDDVPAFIGWTVLREAGASAVNLVSVLEGDEISLRDDCFGGCSEPDFDRFPEEGSTNPYPADDPYGGWLIGEHHGVLGAAAAGGQGGLGAWRAAEAGGSWDSATFGGVQEHLARMMEVRQRYAPPMFVSLGDDACAAQAAVATAPTASLCADQAAGVWAPLQTHGQTIGPRLQITRVGLPGNWHALDPVPLEIDVTNAGGAAPRTHRTLEIVFRDGAGAELLSTTVDAEALDAPSLTGTRALELDLSLASVPAVGTEVTISVRLPHPRTFDGWLRMPHPGVDGEGWYPVATLTVTETE